MRHWILSGDHSAPRDLILARALGAPRLAIARDELRSAVRAGTRTPFTAAIELARAATSS